MLAEGVGEELGKEKKLLYYGLFAEVNMELGKEKNLSLLLSAHMALEMTKSWYTRLEVVGAEVEVDALAGHGIYLVAGK